MTRGGADGTARRDRVVAGAAVALVFGAAFAVNVSRGFNTEDEAWFLQVVARTNDGEVLYRDVFFGATPLAVYVTGAVTRLLGPEMLVVKAVAVAAFTATAALAFHLSRGFGLSRRASAAVVMALGAFALPTIGLYSDVASLLLLLTLAAALRWVGLASPGDTPPLAWWRHPLLLGGAVAGLCFGAKQNVGLLALAALSASALSATATASGRRRLLDAARPLPGFLAGATAVLAPVVLSGGGTRLWDYGFANKGTYLRAGAESYLGQLATLGRLAGRLPASVLALNLQAVILIPPLAAAALLATWPSLAGWERRRALTVTVFLVAALLAVYPRADSAHLADAAPVAVVAIAYAAARWAPAAHRGRRLALGVTLGGLGLATTATLAWAASRLASPDYQALAAPHFGGIPLAPGERARLTSDVRALSTLSALPPDRRPAMLLSAEAGFGYLATGLRNPTPFDYPVATAFGRTGQAATIRAIRQGRIASVCRDERIGGLARLRPVKLDSFVTGRLRTAGALGPCDLYVPDGAAGATTAPAPPPR